MVCNCRCVYPLAVLCMARGRQGYISSLMPSGVAFTRGDPRTSHCPSSCSWQGPSGRAGEIELMGWHTGSGRPAAVQPRQPFSLLASRGSWAPKAGSTARLHGFSRVAWIPSELPRSASVWAVKGTIIHRIRSPGRMQILADTWQPLFACTATAQPCSLSLSAVPLRLTMVQVAGHLACAVAYLVHWRPPFTCNAPCGGKAVLLLGQIRYEVTVAAAAKQVHCTCRLLILFVCFCAPLPLASSCRQHAPCHDSTMSERLGVGWG